MPPAVWLQAAFLKLIKLDIFHHLKAIAQIKHAQPSLSNQPRKVRRVFNSASWPLWVS